MLERPILFSGPMVLAILAGRKTQTRRVVKDSLWACLEPGDFGPDGDADPGEYCPYGQPGDRLWVRETWCSGHGLVETAPGAYFADVVGNLPAAPRTLFRADGAVLPPGTHWRPSIFMKRDRSRLTLSVESVRVERLQDISEEDAKAEGCAGGNDSIPGYRFSATPMEHFRHLWDSINGDRASWASNPWVWVVSFSDASSTGGSR